MSKRLSLDKVLYDFKKIHGDKYDYSKVVYIKNLKEVEIICKEHGSFWQTPSNHKLGSGCSKCKRLSLKEVILRFKKIHGDKYDYSKVVYKNTNTKINIICPKHGNFLQFPYNHFLKGCPKCSNNIIKTQDEHIYDFKKIHGDKYDYSKVVYKNTNTKINIICPKHGEFLQSPSMHKRGNGCPKCKESKGERKIREYLEKNNIEYIQEYILFDQFRFDFYLKDINTVIEYDGKQHFESIEFFGGEDALIKTQERDKIKNDYCIKNNIPIIRIPYTEFKNINIILKEKI